jgi:hypothetical protein
MSISMHHLRHKKQEKNPLPPSLGVRGDKKGSIQYLVNFGVQKSLASSGSKSAFPRKGTGYHPTFVKCGRQLKTDPLDRCSVDLVVMVSPGENVI